jgi:hypothetical protein
MVRSTLHLLRLSNLHLHPTLHTIPLQSATTSHSPDESDQIGWTSSGIVSYNCRKYNILVTIDDICQFQQQMDANYNVASYCVGNRHGVTSVKEFYNLNTQIATDLVLTHSRVCS